MKFIYLQDYDDKDEDISLPHVRLAEPVSTVPSSSIWSLLELTTTLPSNTSLLDQGNDGSDLSLGQLTRQELAQDTDSILDDQDVFLKHEKSTRVTQAWLHLKVHLAAQLFRLDDLASESKTRMANAVANSSQDTGFLMLIKAAFSVATEERALAVREVIAFECAKNLTELVEDSAFIELLRSNASLGCLIIMSIVKTVKERREVNEQRTDRVINYEPEVQSPFRFTFATPSNSATELAITPTRRSTLVQTSATPTDKDSEFVITQTIIKQKDQVIENLSVELDDAMTMIKELKAQIKGGESDSISISTSSTSSNSLTDDLALTKAKLKTANMQINTLQAAMPSRKGSNTAETLTALAEANKEINQLKSFKTQLEKTVMNQREQLASLNRIRTKSQSPPKVSSSPDQIKSIQMRLDASVKNCQTLLKNNGILSQTCEEMRVAKGVAEARAEELNTRAKALENTCAQLKQTMNEQKKMAGMNKVAGHGNIYRSDESDVASVTSTISKKNDSIQTSNGTSAAEIKGPLTYIQKQALAKQKVLARDNVNNIPPAKANVHMSFAAQSNEIDVFTNREGLSTSNASASNGNSLAGNNMPNRFSLKTDSDKSNGNTDPKDFGKKVEDIDLAVKEKNIILEEKDIQMKEKDVAIDKHLKMIKFLQDQLKDARKSQMGGTPTGPRSDNINKGTSSHKPSSSLHYNPVNDFVPIMRNFN